MKLYAIHDIVRPTAENGKEEKIPRRSVFEATDSEKLQYEGLNAARVATKEEIDAAKAATAKASGHAFVTKKADVLENTSPDTRPVKNNGDPQNPPKGKDGK